MIINGLVVACDTETTGLDPWNGDLPFAFSFANEEGDTAYREFPVDRKTRRPRYEDRPKTYRALKRFYANNRVTKIFHNSPFDVRMLEAAGIPVAGTIEDTEFAMRVCNASEMTYELKPLTKKYFDTPDDDKKALVTAVNSLRLKAGKQGYAVASKDSHGDGRKQSDYWLIQYAEQILVNALGRLKTYTGATPNARRKMEAAAREKAAGMKRLCKRYAVTDAERTIALWVFVKELLAELELDAIYQEEMRAIWPVTYAIASRGVYLDRKLVEEGREIAIKQQRIAQKQITKICKAAKSDLNPDTFPNSHPQKTQYFINELGLEPLSETKAGNPQINKTFFEFYESEVPLCRALMDEERASKAIATYFNNYLAKMNEGILHGWPQQMGAKTGRFSFRDPNLQNVPKRGKCERCRADLKIVEFVGQRARCGKCGKLTALDIMLRVRHPFGPRPGFVWYGFDYQQIEARIFADEADEKFMLRAFRKGLDVYQEFADVIESETGLEIGRQDTKHIFLGKLYGLGLKKLVRRIMEAIPGREISEDDAGRVIECFDEAFPGVSGFMQDTIRQARHNGYVVNRYGQRIDVWRDEAYKGVNYIIQSSAARLMKRAMVKCFRYLQELGFGWLVMTIHDELIFEFEQTRRPKSVIKTLARLMEDNDGMFPNVATTVDVNKTVGSWLETVDCDWATAG